MSHMHSELCENGNENQIKRTSSHKVVLKTAKIATKKCIPATNNWLTLTLYVFCFKIADIGNMNPTETLLTNNIQWKLTFIWLYIFDEYFLWWSRCIFVECNVP